MRTLRSVARAGAFAALAGTLCVLAGVFGASLHWSFDLAGQFLLPSMVVSGAAALLAAAFGWFRIAGTAAVLAVAAYLTAMPWTVGPAPVAAQAPRFKILLFNVWFANGQIPDVRKMAEEADADIVVFIETTARIRDQLQPLMAVYPYRFDCIGNARCDITIFARSRLTAPAVKATRDPDRSPLVGVQTEVAGCRLMLFATHMTRPFPNRPFWAQRAQAAEIGDDLGAWSGAKLLLGDFNAAPWGYVIHTIAQRGGLNVLTGTGGTWPSILPPQMRIPIDHMLAGRGLSFVSRRVLPKLGSDHLPVLAEIAVTDPSQCY